MLSADESCMSLCLLVCVKDESCGTLQDEILMGCSGKPDHACETLQLALFVRERAQK